jgi:hypothetical protein
MTDAHDDARLAAQELARARWGDQKAAYGDRDLAGPA